MGLRGFPPRPTVIDEYLGNPDRRPHNKLEPKPTGDAECPRKLTAAAKREWRKLAPILERMRVLTEADSLALGNLCQDLADEYDVAIKIRKSSHLITQKGYVQLNPLFTLQNELRKRISNGFREFGCNPAARTRIQVDGSKDRTDPIGQKMFA
jgi:P27 family predicted phage terminase small subunit